MSFSYQNTNNYDISRKSHSDSGLRSSPSHLDQSLRFNNVTPFTATATLNQHRRDIYRSIYDTSNKRPGYQHRNGNDLTNSNKIHGLPTSTATSSVYGITSTQRITSTAALNEHSNGMYRGIYGRSNESTGYQHRNGNDLVNSNKMHYLATSVDGITPTQQTPSKSNRRNRPIQLYKPKQPLYLVDDTADSIETHIKNTTPASASTSSNYIPAWTRDGLIRTTTATAASYGQDEMGESIEAYIERTEGKRQYKPPEPSTILQNHPTHCGPPSTSLRLLSPDPWNDSRNLTTTTTMTSGNRTSSVPPSAEIINLLSDDEYEQEHTGTTNATSTTSLHDSGDPTQQHAKRQKTDNNTYAALEDPSIALEFHQLFKRRYVFEPGLEPRRKRKGKPPKANDKTSDPAISGLEHYSLVKTLAACTLDLGQAVTDMDEKEELAFFEEETPKDNRRQSKRNLVNGFEGFTDSEDDDDW